MSKQSIQLQAGQKFNRLTVIKLDHIKTYKDNRKKEYFLCQCECGNQCIVEKQSIKNGGSKSCGCLKREVDIKKINNFSYKHGLKKTRLYTIWLNMKTRCLNKNNKNYNNYGGRGITICNEWLHNFQAFYDWAIANGYKDNLTIDRIDNNGNYEPSNCRWATDKEQKRNQRTNINISYNGETHCIAEWADILKINYQSFYNKLKNRSYWQMYQVISALTENEVKND